MKSIIKYGVFALLAMILVASCVNKNARKNNYPAPNIPEPPVGKVYTIDTLLKIWHDAGSPTSGESFAVKDLFKKDCSVYGIVTGDETSGNLYKVAFIQDRITNNAIELRLNSIIGVRIGDSVRVCMKGGTLSVYGGTPQIQDLDASSVIILANNKFIEPQKLVSITECSQHLCQLVTFEGMQFKNPSEVWAVLHETSATSTYSNRDMEQFSDDCIPTQGKLVARTSAYASFADQPLPQGKGTITGILTYFSGSNEYQLSVRTMSEVLMDGPRCE